jgi:hypothetical protein
MNQRALAIGPLFSPEDYNYGVRSSGESHGVVHTQGHIVELMLDIAGYTRDRDLSRLRLLEPACGLGAFLIPAAARLLDSVATMDGRLTHHPDLTQCLVGIDVAPKHVEHTRHALGQLLNSRGYTGESVARLLKAWVREGDSLLTDLGTTFDVVVGNPPYVRVEQLSPRLNAEYRRRFATLYDRADLYIAFIERALQLLSDDGVVTLICADRWTRNRYGKPLRALIARAWHVHSYVDLHQASPFESDVTAYPAIVCIGRTRRPATMVARLAEGTPEECDAVSAALASESPIVRRSFTVERHATWFGGDTPWVLSSPVQLAALRSLEGRFATIEADGLTSVGIGVATGCDRAYIVDDSSDIEADRLVPLVMRSDIDRGSIHWRRRFVINVFDDDGRVVPLDRYERLSTHVGRWEREIRQRHVARKSGVNWYRTIDRVYPDLATKPKLLIPDIAGSAEVIFDEGRFHPHHNLYFVTSRSGDLEVLGGLLSSRVALFCVWSYAVRMRGGYLRFQAQYLRRIRVPDPSALSPQLAGRIRDAFRRRAFQELDLLAIEAYDLSELPDFDFIDTRH